MALSTAGRRSPDINRPNMSETQLQGIPAVSLSSRRIVLLGKAGVGKSAAGNTILGQKVFRSAMRMGLVTSECSAAQAAVSGRSVTVVDTPGFFDTQMKHEELMTEIGRSVYLSSPGPHAFLIVFPVDRMITEHEQQIPQMIEMMFGEEVLKYSILLFTHGDQLDGESVEELIEESSRLRRLVDQCGGRFHVFNNRDQSNREQVNDLLQKIDSMIEQNGGGHYSHQMFEDAQRFRREEEERRQQHDYGVKMEGTHLMPKVCLNLVLLGRTGAGKSSTGNTILGREAFNLMKRYESISQDVAAEVGDVCGLLVAVYDTPGFSGVQREGQLWKYQEVLKKCESGMCAFLLVLRSDRFTQEDQEIVKKIEKLLGEKHLNKTWILFTRGDELEKENKKLNEVINETEFLKELTQKYEGRFHLLNNKKKGQSDQVKSLITDVFQNNLKNLSKNPWQSITISVKDTSADTLSYKRIVLLGKSGSGKSSAGNTILGQEVFKSTLSSKSVTSECSVGHATVSGRKMSVVDTPGLFDTEMSPEEFMKEIMKSVYLSSPGPHAFLIVFNVNMKITEQEEKIPQMIEMLFGQEVLKYSIILFTHGDLLKGNSMEQVIKENSRLKHLVDQCGGRYQVFNNKDQKNRKQVSDLEQKSNTMIEQNRGGHYSNQMFRDAWRFRQEQRMRTKSQGIFNKIGATIAAGVVFGGGAAAVAAGAIIAAPISAVVAGAAGVAAVAGAYFGGAAAAAADRADNAAPARRQRRQREEEERRQQEENEDQHLRV